jgi:hypothetical protein
VSDKEEGERWFGEIASYSGNIHSNARGVTGLADVI